MTRNRTPEALTCGACGGVYKGLGALNAHKFYKHKVSGAATTCPPVAAPGEGALPEAPSLKVSFRSPKAGDLRIVIRPQYWIKTETPAGTQQVLSEGKVAEFREGIFITEDPEIIDFLENKYKDGRYPVLSLAKIRAFGRGLV
jgi:hypothetical protein